LPTFLNRLATVLLSQPLIVQPLTILDLDN